MPESTVVHHPNLARFRLAYHPVGPDSDGRYAMSEPLPIAAASPEYQKQAVAGATARSLLWRLWSLGCSRWRGGGGNTGEYSPVLTRLYRASLRTRCG